MGLLGKHLAEVCCVILPQYAQGKNTLLTEKQALISMHKSWIEIGSVVDKQAELAPTLFGQQATVVLLLLNAHIGSIISQSDAHCDRTTHAA